MKAIKRVQSTDSFEGDSLKEAAAGDFHEVIALVRASLKAHLGMADNDYLNSEAIYADRIVVRSGKDARFMAYPYSIADDNQVTFGQPHEVMKDHVPVQMRESVSAFLEADANAPRFRIRVIKAGLSLNKNYYPDLVLREAVPLFDGVRVFVKSDQEHLHGQGKSFRNLIGRISAPAFIAGNAPDTGEIQANLDLLEAAGEVTAKMREAYARGMADDLFGFSIDARAVVAKRRGNIVESKKITQVKSLDLIIEPGAGGQIIDLIEAFEDKEKDVSLRKNMVDTVKKANNGQLPDGLDIENDDELEAAFREAVANGTDATNAGGRTENDNPAAGNQLTQDDLNSAVAMLEARAEMRVKIAESNLPEKAKNKLRKQFEDMDSYTVARVTEAISDETEYLASLTESGKVSGMGDGRIEHMRGESDNINQMLDDMFDPSKPAVSIREAYIRITGDTRVTGLAQNCDMGRLREAAGEMNLREAVSAATFGNILGDSITRAMLREYRADDLWSDWRFLVDIVPVNDFRTQERTRMGGYGDLPTVAENGAYNALTTPGDEKATYALAKKGGKETLSLEAVANDDVGLVQRIPMKLSVASARTLYKFVMAFIDTNAAIYDAAALFHASHNNLATAALSATTFAARRKAMLQQTELTSAQRLGLVARHLLVPTDLEETAFDMFVRNTNNDETFVQSRKPQVHVVPHWTDANDWFLTADKREVPLIEMGFYGGQEEPELFIQDNPSQGSLFSNDQIAYKIRHIYSGTVTDFRGFQGNLVV